MPQRIAEYCKKTGQAVPESVGETVRCIFDSLALCYRKSADNIEKLTGKRYNIINIIGGGTKERLLSTLTASATGKYVVAGPDEATALGNIAVQAYAAGELLRNRYTRSGKTFIGDRRVCPGSFRKRNVG